ncbi:NAD(P)-dependent oxidoreductase [Microbispora sp. CA-102843]|uniref:NAD(P)-dependent oxidoreductase n=1 Tax=Microbispora sp. CA-102843 TaxID=3239952 RepID=UPI003D8E214C
MKLLIFGATGGTGAQLLAQALDAGHDVTVVARNPDKIPAHHRDRSVIVPGDVLQARTWDAVTGGHDAVLSCLGSRDRRHPTVIYSQGTANIIGAMRMALMEGIVTASPLDWTIIRPPMLTDRPPTGRYRAAAGHHLPDQKSISRADLAHYMLNHIEDQKTWKKIVWPSG